MFIATGSTRNICANELDHALPFKNIILINRAGDNELVGSRVGELWCSDKGNIIIVILNIIGSVECPSLNSANARLNSFMRRLVASRAITVSWQHTKKTQATFPRFRYPEGGFKKLGKFLCFLFKNNQKKQKTGKTRKWNSYFFQWRL